MPEKRLTIREVASSDLPMVLALYADLGHDDGQVLPLDRAEALFRRMQNYPDYKLYLAFHQDRPVGTFALLIMDNLGHMGTPSAIVEDVVVDPAVRGAGIGRQMMAFAYQRAQDRGCYKIALTSNLHRTEAHRFYEGLGFEQHGFSFFITLEPQQKDNHHGN